MKNRFLTLLIATTGPLLGSLMEPSLVDLPKVENETSYDSYTRRAIPYVQLGPDLVDIHRTNRILPGIGAGIRSESMNHAVDLGFTFSQTKTRESSKESKYQMQVLHPKLMYLTFLEPNKPKTFFYGFGGAWGSKYRKIDTITKVQGNGFDYEKHTSETSSFSGLLGGTTVGYETGRESVIRQIIALEILQPAFPFYQKHPSYFPSVNLSYSLGF